MLISFSTGQAIAYDGHFDGRLIIEAADGVLRGPRVNEGDGHGEVWEPIWQDHGTGQRHHIRRWEITNDLLDLDLFAYFGINIIPRGGFVPQRELSEAEREALPDGKQDFEFNLEAREPEPEGDVLLPVRNHIRVLFQLTWQRSRGVSLSANPYESWWLRVFAESNPRKLIGPIEGVVPWSFHLDDFDPFPPAPLELMSDGEEREPYHEPDEPGEVTVYAPPVSVGSEPTGAPRFDRQDPFESEG